MYGPDLMGDVLDRGRASSLGHYLYGSTPEVLAALTDQIEQRWPGARIVGSESPPFREITDDELAASLRRADELGADVVWVGMGTPKQDLLVRRMAEQGDATYVAVGAAFDFIAGVKRQAPSWMQRAGLEWLFRLVTEPRRLARRYLVYNAKFLQALVVDQRHRRSRRLDRMRVVIVHNRYRSENPSGENRVVESDIETPYVDGVEMRPCNRNIDGIVRRAPRVGSSSRWWQPGK